ncbi:type II toxin-antitoxin system RelE/ParE family toxin [soil metagenome]
MTYKLTVTLEARNDVRDIYDWYEEQRIGLGDLFLNEAVDRLNFIENQPYIFQIRFQPIRMCLLIKFPYSIHYEVDTDEVIVWLVCHQHRDSKKILKDRLT